MATETVSHGAEASSAGADAAHKAADSGGLPQLDFSTFSNQIFWLAVTLVAIYLILSRIALPRIASVLAERQGTITNDLSAAEEMKLKAEEAEVAYNQALTDARAEANKIIAQAKADIQADLDVAIAKADAEISAKTAESEKAIAEIRDGAMESVKAVATDTAAEIVASLGGSSDAKSIEAAIASQMKG